MFVAAIWTLERFVEFEMLIVDREVMVVIEDEEVALVRFEMLGGFSSVIGFLMAP